MPNSKTGPFKVSQRTDWEDLFVDWGRVVFLDKAKEAKASRAELMKLSRCQ